ncbi:DUF6281 family protein [Streptomyces sp. M2CJ-2]|uniref:DUF6281 family protein n=1 Tax=Streptomyces sp. M2CJ-2 TaxID=2803948 RepID=UPI001F16EA5D|nr:DUF6281 family protein [Streptomyces sp. M2CJ-2]
MPGRRRAGDGSEAAGAERDEDAGGGGGGPGGRGDRLYDDGGERRGSQGGRRLRGEVCVPREVRGAVLPRREGAVGDRRGVHIGKDLGTGLLPGCDESGEVDGTEKPEKVTVYEVEGIDPAVAVAAGKTPGEAVLVAVQGADLTSLDDARR